MIFLSGSPDSRNKYALNTYFVSGPVLSSGYAKAGKLARASFLQSIHFGGRHRAINPGIKQLYLNLYYHAKNTMLHQNNNERHRIFMLYPLISIIEHIFKALGLVWMLVSM